MNIVNLLFLEKHLKIIFFKKKKKLHFPKFFHKTGIYGKNKAFLSLFFVNKFIKLGLFSKKKMYFNKRTKKKLFFYKLTIYKKNQNHHDQTILII